MNVEDLLKNMKAYVWEEKFTVLKVKEIPENKDFFCIIKDKKEITIILKETDINDVNFMEVEKDYRLITFDAVLPFNLVGFMSAISTSLANAGIGILAISSYSTDHILVKDKNLNKTIKVLKNLGIKME
jgi:hypothetical protein